MFKLPPLKTEAIVVISGTGVPLLLLTMLANGAGKPVPKTVTAALLLALISLGFLAICLGSLCSATVRSWLYESPEAAEESALGLLVGSGVSALLTGHLLYRAWELFHTI
jgi:hypothetical protein